MGGQVLHRAARLDAADARAPAVFLERAVHVHRHGVGGVGPAVLVVVGVGGVFLEVELVDRVGLGAVGQAREEARHAHREVARVVGLAQRAPGGVLGRAEDLGQVARVGELLPRLHLHHRGARAGDEGRVRRGGHLGHLGQQLHVGRRVVEVVVAHQRAVGLAAELAVFLFVQLLEQRRLVPGRALEALERLAQVLLGDVEHADLQLLVGLGVVHQVVQAAPRRLQLLEVLVVDDAVDLLGELLVERGDHALDGLDRVAADDVGVGQRLLRQRLHRLLHRALGLGGLGLEFLLEQRREVVAFERDAGQRRAL